MSSDPFSPEVLVSVPSDIEAASIVAALAAYNIHASTEGGYTAGFRAEAPGDIHVVVRKEDLEQARTALADIRKAQQEIDWSQVDVDVDENGE